VPGPHRAAAVLAAAAVVAGAAAVPAAAPASVGSPQTLLSGLNLPWGLAFLPDGSALAVADSDAGRIIQVRAGAGGATQRTVMTVPGVDPEGEGGLLGLAVSPRYARDRYVYAYMSTPSDNRIVRFRLGGPVRTLVRGIPHASIHNGGRLAFGPDGMLYASTGDGGVPSRAQQRRSLGGKILRLRPDGRAAPGNPRRGSRVFTLGHRNVQGLAFDGRGRLFASELGQNSFDEVNRIRAGRNYGWPAVEGRGTGGGRYVSPLVTWRTSEASPSGAAILGSTLYVAALRGERLWQVPLRGGRTGRPRAALRGTLGRLRTVAVAPDRKSLWILTANGNGKDLLVRVPVS
jgi:glucose/arabinose dehydrogenase